MTQWRATLLLIGAVVSCDGENEASEDASPTSFLGRPGTEQVAKGSKGPDGAEEVAVERFGDPCHFVEQANQHDSCVEKLAKARQDPEICRYVRPGVVEDCLQRVAWESGDMSVCSKVEDRHKREGCFRSAARANGDPASCKGLEMNDRDACVEGFLKQDRLAFLVKDVCLLHQRPALRDKCLLEYSEKAEDASACKEVLDASRKALCEARFTPKAEDAYELCLKAPDHERSACIGQAAYKNPGFCIAGKLGSVCIERNARGPGSPEDCNSIELKLRPECFAGYAVFRHDPSLCDALESAAHRDACRIEVARRLAHTEACLRVAPELRVRCAAEIWARAKDSRLCPLLTGGARAGCLAAVGRQ